eukprot:TRINITY_DN14589_c0_g1_i1.p2 TRINITY_DN14589_c0_g1~~TRINITY_DN14589_c0_g1_i1.p2  ORF type:complete len:181 (+),score=55.01 TRINITY_DN14589_c0_g1_i1:66-545(+)
MRRALRRGAALSRIPALALLPAHVAALQRPQLQEQGRGCAAGADGHPPTIFDKILSGDIPSQKVWEDDVAFAFRDVSPQAPTHILIIPKHRDGLVSLSEAEDRHKDALGHLMLVAAKVAKQEGLEGWRVVVNNGRGGGQTVFHLHLHLIGGRPLSWPPG